MVVPLVVLAALSVVGGLIGTPWGNVFERFLEPSVAGRNLISAHEGLPPALGLLIGALIAVAGVGAGVLAYRTRGQAGFLVSDKVRASNPLYVGAANLWYVDAALYRVFVVGGGRLADGLWRWADRFMIDGAVNAIAWCGGAAAEVLRRTQTGYLRTYAVTMLIGVAALVAWFLGGSMRP